MKCYELLSTTNTFWHVSGRNMEKPTQVELAKLPTDSKHNVAVKNKNSEKGVDQVSFIKRGAD